MDGPGRPRGRRGRRPRGLADRPHANDPRSDATGSRPWWAYRVVPGIRRRTAGSGPGGSGGAMSPSSTSRLLQLAQDRMVADRDGLSLRTVPGDMADLSAFADRSFGLVVHPCSNWLCPGCATGVAGGLPSPPPGGVLMAGFVNPVLYVFDDAAAERGELVARHSDPLLRLDEPDGRRKGGDTPTRTNRSLRAHAGRSDRRPARAGLHADRFLRGPASGPPAGTATADVYRHSGGEAVIRPAPRAARFRPGCRRAARRC